MRLATLFFWKLLRALLHALQGFWAVKTIFPRLAQRDREQRVQLWAKKMLVIIGVDLVVHGQRPSAGPVLFVANHISWLDILVMHASYHCRFVSKSDVGQWPFVRTLAFGAGTLYVERTLRRDAHRVVRLMAERLQAGDVLAVFPEGTTGDGVTLRPFHANLLQAAIEAGVPAQPVALRFVDLQTGAISFAPRYVDDDTLCRSVWKTLTAPPLRAVVRFGEPQLANGRTRRDWVQTLRQDIENLRLH